MSTSRREFIKRSLGASSLLAFSGVVPGFLGRSALAAGASSDTAPVLVVLQLSGGNDGLNTVVPYEDDNYQRNRPTLRLSGSQVHKLEAGLGLHPEMAAFHRLYHEGHLSIVQGVGYPNSQREHGPAMRDWHTAAPQSTLSQTGWVGRAIDQAYNSGLVKLPGVFAGQIKPPLSVQSETALVPALHSSAQWLLDDSEPALAELAGFTRGKINNPLLEFVQRATLDACACNRRRRAVLQAGNSSSATAYPAFPLAQTLKSVADLIRAELGIRLYFAELGGGEIGGFDTHAGQAANHGALLRELSESVAAFLDDLRRDHLLSSVLVLTFSEFGRSLSENGRRGTGHGAAAPMFVAGASLPRRLVGAHPNLAELENDAPKFHTDFRRVYATVLDQWLQFDSQAVLGQRFELVEGLLGSAK